MIGVFGKPSSSGWWRVIPTRPSVMYEGQTTSVPASAWEIAVFASSSSEMSLSTSPSRTKPQWPCDVYSQRQTSVMTVRPGCASFTARTASWTTPSESYAPDPTSSLADGMPKSSTPGTPAAWRSPASETSSLIDRREMPGMEATGSRVASSATTKSGWIRWRTRARSRGRGLEAPWLRAGVACASRGSSRRGL